MIVPPAATGRLSPLDEDDGPAPLERVARQGRFKLFIKSGDGVVVVLVDLLLELRVTICHRTDGETGVLAADDGRETFGVDLVGDGERGERNRI